MKICKCGNPIPSTITTPDGYNYVTSRKSCLTCVPFGQSIYSRSNYHKRKAKNQSKYKRRFIEKHGVNPIALRRLRYKHATVSYLVNSACQFCGYNKTMKNLTFHHVDPSTKSFIVDSRRFQFAYLETFSEIKKCVVACHNCHGEIHEGLISDNTVREKYSHILNKISLIQAEDWSEFLQWASDQGIKLMDAPLKSI